MKNLIARLLERRVPQYLVAYIGVAWGIMQFTQRRRWARGPEGRLGAAYALRRDYLRTNPTDPFVHTGIAECLRELGRLAEAEQAIRVALQRIPGVALERALGMWPLAEPDFEPAAEARALLAAL